ncbi:MAG TPA: DUF4199 domain-containing protein [Balneolales bacterium]|nr:DUF4199 domain-containing protein [Balneolales bacterium]
MEPVEEKRSFWASVILASLIFGVIYFAMTIGTGYYVINNPPTGSGLGPSSIIGTFVCLIAAFGGMLAVWHYVQLYDVTITLGKGAVIGVVTGIFIGILSFIFVHLWEYVDPNYTSRLMDTQIAMMNAKNHMSAQERQKIVDMMHSRGSMFKIIGSIFTTLGLGILNLITGMIGAKMFKGEKPEETF